PTNSGACPARSCAHHNPARYRMFFQLHLAEDTLRDVVVSTPVGGYTSVGELVHVVTVGFMCELVGSIVNITGILYKVAFAAVKRNGVDLRLGGAGRHN